MDERQPEHTEHEAEPTGVGEDEGSTRLDEDYDVSVERKYVRRRIAPAWFAGAGALALAGGFALLSAMRDQNVDLSAPPRLPRKVRPAPTPIPAAPPLPTPSPDQEAALKDAMARADAWAQAGVTEPPQPSLVVCEPSVVGKATATSVQAFGDGCARWLHLNAAGEPNMGATPLWHRVEYARLSIADERGLQAGSRAAFRPSASDVAALYRATGAARIAVGRLQLAGASPLAPAVLSFEVWDAPGKRRLSILSVQGTRAAIAQQLPSLARSLRTAASTSAGAKEIPARCELSAGELETVGQVPWSVWNVAVPGEPASNTQVQALEKLAPRSALAALEVLYDYPHTFGDLRYTAAQAHLLRLAPRNALAWSGASCLNASSLHGRQKDLDALASRYPLSAPLSLSQAYRAHTVENPKLAYAWASRALHLAPRDPVCWRDVGSFAGNQADTIRYGRYSGQISRDEWAVLSRWYQIHLFCDAHAASLDGRDGRTWEDLCRAASFSSDSTLAQGALWRGLALDPESEGLCGWALEMLQPKWGGDHEQMSAMITHIECTRPLFESLHADAIQALTNAADTNSPYANEGSQMLSRTVNRLQDEARLEPSRPEPHLYLAHVAKRFGLRDTQYGTALREFGLYLKLRPWDANAHYALAWMLHYKTKQLDRARLEYESALRIKPDYPDVLSDAAELLMSPPSSSAARQKARALVSRALSLQRWPFLHVQMGRLLLDDGDRVGARREAQTALAMGYKEQDRLFEALNLNRGAAPAQEDDGADSDDEPKPGD